MCLLASDFPSENRRSQTRTILIRTVANKWFKRKANLKLNGLKTDIGTLKTKKEYDRTDPQRKNKPLFREK